MEILIITATEKESNLSGVRVFDGLLVTGEKCLVLKANELSAKLAGESAEWRPLWQHKS